VAIKVRTAENTELRKITVMEISGSMTIGKGDVELREKFKSLLGEGHRHFLFDLNRVGYMDSAAIGEAAACMKRAQEHKAQIKIALAPSGKPEQLFQVTMLDRVFEIFHDVDDAIASFG
jgi:anti-anti-sigma factor